MGGGVRGFLGEMGDSLGQGGSHQEPEELMAYKLERRRGCVFRAGEREGKGRGKQRKQSGGEGSRGCYLTVTAENILSILKALWSSRRISSRWNYQGFCKTKQSP